MTEALTIREEKCLEENEIRGLEKKCKMGLGLNWIGLGICGQKDEAEV